MNIPIQLVPDLQTGPNPMYGPIPMIEVADVYVDMAGQLVACDAWGHCVVLGPAYEPEDLARVVPREALTQVPRIRPRITTWEDRINLPNAITFLGYAASLAWLGGAPLWLGLFGILADEIDGRVARATGKSTLFGCELDYAVDLTLTGLSALRLGGLTGLALLPIVTGVQAALRADQRRPAFGSARALMMAGAMLRGR